MKYINHMLVVLSMLMIGFVAESIAADDNENQSDPEAPCSAPEFSQFDFWIGEWDLSWGDSASGTSVITKELDNCVIIEKFDGNPGVPLKGMSISTFNLKTGQWRHTWVDNSGGHLDFTGEFVDRRMVLTRVAEVNGKLEHHRLIWYNITEDSLDWSWEKSVDGGLRWETGWQMRHQRAH